MLYVLSDIHGHKKDFDSIMQQINLQPEDTLYVLGDVIDKGDSSIKLLKLIMAMPNAKMLLGNHEHMMIDFFDAEKNKESDEGNYRWQVVSDRWYSNAGKKTEKQFRKETEESQKEILDFLINLPLCFDVSVNGIKYKLVHAVPIEMYNPEEHCEYEDAKQFAVWHRVRKGFALADGDTLIFGHTPTVHYTGEKKPMHIWFGNKAIGIDCGLAHDDRLGCLRLDDMKEFYSK